MTDTETILEESILEQEKPQFLIREKVKVEATQKRSKVIIAAQNTGSANAVAPVIKRLNLEDRLDIIKIGYAADKNLERVFRSNGIDYLPVYDISPSFMEQILEKEKPNLVLTGAEAQNKDDILIVEQSIRFVAKQRGVFSLAVLDSWGNLTMRFSDMYNNGVYDPKYVGGKFKFLSDKILIMDNFVLEEMLKEGFDRDRLIVTGNPHFDSIYDLRQRFREEEKAKVRSDLNLDQDSFVFMFASQPIEKRRGNQYGYTEKTSLKEMLDSLSLFSQDKKVNVLVNVHPAQDKEELEPVVSGYNFKIILDRDYDTYKAILASDAVVSAFSTVLVEACYLGKPAVSLQPGLVGKYPFTVNGSGALEVVYRHGEFISIVKKLLFDYVNYSKELAQKREILDIDGKATDRVVDLVYSSI